MYSPEQINITSIILNSEKFSEPLVLLQQKGVSPVIEFNIYENITQPFLTGNAVLYDDISLFDKTDINGSERITIEFETPTQESSIISKTFIILKIDSNIKYNDYSSVVQLSLIEDIGFLNKVQTISKAYNGKGEDIIKNIIRENIYREVDNNHKESFQKDFRYIAPYESPFDSVKSILAKMTTEFGMPYFFFSSVNNERLILKDLETIMLSESFNQQPYRLNQSTTKNNELFALYNFDGYDLEDTYNLVKHGSLSASYVDIDVTTGDVERVNFNYKDRIKTLYDNGLIPPEFNVLPINEYFEPDTTETDKSTLLEYDHARLSNISMPVYKDTNSYSTEEYQFYNINSVMKNAILRNMLKNIYKVYLPGAAFTLNSPNVGVGNLIDIEILRNDATQSKDDNIDKKRSGKYIMMAKRHIINVAERKHTVSLEISKLLNQENN